MREGPAAPTRREREVHLTKTAIEVGMEGFSPELAEFMEQKTTAMRSHRPDVASSRGQGHRTFEWTLQDALGDRLSPNESPYTKSEIDKDLRLVQKRKREYGLPATDGGQSSRESLEYIEKQSKKLSEFMEAMLVENGSLLFDNATVHSVSEFTDLVEGIDAVVAVRDADKRISQIIGLDFTFEDKGARLAKKLENSARGVVKGELASAKYVYIDGTNIEAKMIPKVTIPLSAETVKMFGETWRTKGALERSDMPQRDALLQVIDKQLVMQKVFALQSDGALFRGIDQTSNASGLQATERRAAMAASLDATREYLREFMPVAAPAKIDDVALREMNVLLNDSVNKDQIFAHAVERVREENARYAERHASAVPDQPVVETHASETHPAPAAASEPQHEHEEAHHAESAAAHAEGEHGHGDAEHHEAHHDAHETHDAHVDHGGHEHVHAHEHGHDVHHDGGHAEHDHAHADHGHGHGHHGSRWPQNPKEWAAFAGLLGVGGAWMTLKAGWGSLKIAWAGLMHSLFENKPKEKIKTFFAGFKLGKGGGGGHGGGHGGHAAHGHGHH